MQPDGTPSKRKRDREEQDQTDAAEIAKPKKAKKEEKDKALDQKRKELRTVLTKHQRLDEKTARMKKYIGFLEKSAEAIKKAEPAHLKAADMRIVNETMLRFTRD